MGGGGGGVSLCVIFEGLGVQVTTRGVLLASTLYLKEKCSWDSNEYSIFKLFPKDASVKMKLQNCQAFFDHEGLNGFKGQNNTCW